jgi:hypothetical protein
MPHKAKDVFHPFSLGPMGCIGKNLAYMEVRLLTALIVRRFDVRLAPGETGETLLMGTKDHVSFPYSAVFLFRGVCDANVCLMQFTLGLGKLELCFEPRKM